MFTEIADRVADVMDDAKRECKQVTRAQRSKIRLDDRAIPYQMWYDEDTLIINKRDERTLNYYGGFEYVPDTHRMTVGEYVIFSREDGRVEEVIEALIDNEDEEPEVDDSTNGAYESIDESKESTL